MTAAEVPAVAGSPTELLDRLDALRADGTPGEWGVYWGDRIGSGVVWTTPNGSGVTVQHDVCEMQDADDRACSDNAYNPASSEDDAALIVAAVNAAPVLTAAIRAALDPGFTSDGSSFDEGYAAALRDVEHRITAALAPAVSE